MSRSGIRECKSTIQLFTAANSLQRLHEILPVIFDRYQIYALETQRTILRECSLTPVISGHRVSFCLEQGLSTLHPLPSPPSPTVTLGTLELYPRDSTSSTTSASERSWPSSEEIEPD